MSDRDAGPVALITGSGSLRVGNVVARDLAAHGYRVGIHYRTSEDSARKTVAELEAAGATASCFAADIADEDDVRRMVDRCHDIFGRLDVLVCAAARWSRNKLEEVTKQRLLEEWETNTAGTFLCAREVGLRMVEQESGGSIVAIGDWAIGRPYVDHVAYFASKGAIPTMTRTLAVELAERNPRVRVNAVMPGPVMLPESIADDERAEVIKATLLKREGAPENVAHAVRFLIENDFVTGVCLPVDGGRSIYAAGY
ncbi:Glucose 1-dehydrogenase 2 [Planctomycetes bacterium Pan216]|uniref:Glucose 1-dehydrogenase 2 n=1 Tax=Kolteria novifilia TaxID=2527975 RepID=A0A518B2H4_9BACT|nr:Glucose 1-dehydrogenase 2 [Planctomycetes bacterium Pan216]